VLHAARCKYRTQKLHQKSLSAHHRTTLSGYIFATKACIDNRKKLVKWQYLVNFGPLTAEIRWQVWGTPANFKGGSRLGFVSAPTSLNGGQPNFVRSLAVSCTGMLYIHFWGLVPPNGILRTAKFTLRPSLAISYIGSVTARHLSSGRQPKFAAWYKEWNYGTFADGATYIWQGGHHVGHRPTF